jgi:hypothetical protein
MASLLAGAALADEPAPSEDRKPGVAAGDVSSAAAAVPGVFGFSGLEIYKLDADVSRLRAQDLNRDGRTDIAVVNNTRATIDFFIQKSPEEIAASQAKPVEYDNINEIASDARFRKESFLTEKKVFDLLVEDLDRDGYVDLAYYGDPKEMVFVRGGEKGWSSERQRSHQEARAFGRGLGSGDLNGDGGGPRALEANVPVLQAGGKLAEPVEFPNSEKSLSVPASPTRWNDRADLVLAGSGLVADSHPLPGPSRARPRDRRRDGRVPLPSREGLDGDSHRIAVSAGPGGSSSSISRSRRPRGRLRSDASSSSPWRRRMSRRGAASSSGTSTGTA